MNTQNALVIVNPVAGRKQGSGIITELTALLQKCGYNPSVYITEKRGQATEIVKEYGSDSARIVCCGGDGTLNEIITGILGAGICTPISYIPTGTTNDLAAALRLPTKLSDAVNLSVQSTTRNHDVGMWGEDRFFSYSASFGAFTKVSYETPQWQKNTFGKLAYLVNGVLSIGDIASYRVKVTTDNEEISGEYIFGSISNSTVIGGIVHFNESDVAFDDGKFELLLIKKPSNRLALRNIAEGLRRNYFDERYVHLAKLQTATIFSDTDMAWSIDGEYGKAVREVKIRNLPRAIRLTTLQEQRSVQSCKNYTNFDI